MQFPCPDDPLNISLHILKPYISFLVTRAFFRPESSPGSDQLEPEQIMTGHEAVIGIFIPLWFYTFHVNLFNADHGRAPFPYIK
jgi:hypothetical protein